ncbi:Ribonuclease inhibitor [Anabarilius grahami]|uniref:Ribonuclease inhibitor n=1 Tax=Anabarilius grahami TaxID=495550 RepID=A0A3N0Z0G0_ANAGA|nr:Ribonuclease inhibitor [Anabarilius grahami]
MLAAVVVLFLAAGFSDSVILSKCELKQQLQTGLTLPPNTTDLLAQIVCHVQLTSNFNTSAIKTITEPEKPCESHGSRKGRAAKKGRPSTKVTPKPHLESGEDKNEVWTLYGLFQLSDHVVCNSTRHHSLNLCGLTCNKLLDDNINDDVACVQVLINKISVQMERLKSSESSCVSMKSDQSMDPIVNFSGHTNHGFRLSQCKITAEGCAALTSALRSNSHLRLDLTENKIGDEGLMLLSDGLKDPHCKLEKLTLSRCKITAEGCAALTSALRSNSHLRDLDLTENKIGDADVESLSALKDDPHYKLETLL